MQPKRWNTRGTQQPGSVLCLTISNQILLLDYNEGSLRDQF
jgi:hypothetical protein